MPENYDIPIHDIKPLLEIQEYSLYYLIALGTLALVLLIGLLFLFLKWLKVRNRFNLRKEHLKLLNSIDFSQSKKAAYEITLYGYTFQNDSPRHQRAYHDLLEKLEQFKYKKEVDPLDSETIHYVDLYRGLIDV